ncbi:MAG: methionyl-tRNA formyltransferase [Vicinamibacteria bacterium]|nr:methionyl-tRNA formyltransferase [Vicinamibacteria bacterium]
MRLVFFGSGSFAVPSLQALFDHGHDMACVVTQPDRPGGRGLVPKPPPVKIRALDLGLLVTQPENVRSRELVDRLRAFTPDVQVVAAYGRILPPAIFDLPLLGTINVHASLLPLYRGAAPIQWAIARGESETGVTIMRIEEGLDTGPIYLSACTPIDEDETYSNLEPRLARLGADLLARVLPQIESGRLRPVPQDHARATLAPMLSKKDSYLDWSRPAEELARRIRAFHPWPGSTIFHGSRPIRVISARSMPPSAPCKDDAGTIVAIDREGMVVVCGEGSRLHILALQPESRRAMSAAAFAAGARLKPGFRFNLGRFSIPNRS